MTSPDDHLVVWLAGRPAADLFRGDSRGPVLTYREEYLAKAYVPISPVFVPTTGPQDRRRVSTYLDHLLPDNLATRQQWAQQFGVGTSHFDLLSAMGQDAAGAIQFLPEGRIEDRRSGYQQASDEEIGTRLRALRADAASWTMPTERWSLAGAQSKFTLARLKDGWAYPEGSAASTHIVKPGITTLHHQELVEHVTMRAALKLGLIVAPTHWRDFDGQPALIVQRFDRLTRGNEIIRLHQVDMCQALGMGPKYESNGGPSVAQVAEVIRRHSSNPETDLSRFGDALMFNYLAGAPDAHAKNYALIITASGSRLAPLYDLATALPYDQPTIDRNMAMSIGGRRKPGEVLPRHIQRMAERDLKIDPAGTLQRYRELNDQILDAFADALREVSDASGATDLRERLLPRLSAVTTTVRTQFISTRHD